MYEISQKAIICLNHPKPWPGQQWNGHYKEYSMHEGKVTYKDKLDSTKEIVEEFLSCPRCFQTIAITPELREVLDALKNGTNEPIPDNAIKYTVGDIGSGTPAANAAASA
jgi:hypothetical protein